MLLLQEYDKQVGFNVLKGRPICFIAKYSGYFVDDWCQTASISNGAANNSIAIYVLDET